MRTNINLICTIDVRIFQERIKKLQFRRRVFTLIKKRGDFVFDYPVFLIDKMCKHNEHAHIYATNDAKLLNHQCKQIPFDYASH